MGGEVVFDGHLEQIDYQDDVIRGLHLVSRDGERWLVKLDPPKEPVPLLATRRMGPLWFLTDETRPPVTIERERP
jgi:hypothetical protein